jgi:hypothetical protein
MTHPQDLSDFTPQLLASEEIRAYAKKEWGQSFQDKWTAFECGESLDGLYELVSEAKMSEICENLGGFEGAAPDNDTFLIQTYRIGPVFFVNASEFDDIEYFGSAAEADEYAQDFFSSWVEELAERNAEDEEDEICDVDDQKGKLTLVARGDDWPDDWSGWLEPLVEKYAALVERAFAAGLNLSEMGLHDGVEGMMAFAEELGVEFEREFWEGECISGYYQHGWITTSDIPQAERKGLKILADLELKIRSNLA